MSFVRYVPEAAAVAVALGGPLPASNHRRQCPRPPGRPQGCRPPPPVSMASPSLSPELRAFVPELQQAKSRRRRPLPAAPGQAAALEVAAAAAVENGPWRPESTGPAPVNPGGRRLPPSQSPARPPLLAGERRPAAGSRGGKIEHVGDEMISEGRWVGHDWWWCSISVAACMQGRVAKRPARGVAGRKRTAAPISQPKIRAHSSPVRGDAPRPSCRPPRKHHRALSNQRPLVDHSNPAGKRDQPLDKMAAA